MSTSSTQLLDFANFVTNNEAYAKVVERVQQRLFTQFRAATPAMREQINAIMDADSYFYQELEVIIAENAKLTD